MAKSHSYSDSAVALGPLSRAMEEDTHGGTLDLTKDDSDGGSHDVDMQEDAELQSLETELHQVCTCMHQFFVSSHITKVWHLQCMDMLISFRDESAAAEELGSDHVERITSKLVQRILHLVQHLVFSLA